jgi:hypothetical protein
MNYIFCIEKNKGLTFFGKRQSEDSILREWILNYVNGAKLWVSRYTATQFKDTATIMIDDDYAHKAEENDFCWVEDKPYDISLASQVIVCNWNRRYPADKFFKEDLKALGFKKIKKEEIKGSSHDKITIEIYQRR